MPDLSKKRERERLKARHEPHWMRLKKGQYLGYRRGADTWHVRLRDRNGKQHQTALSTVHSYDEAKQAAEAWLGQMGSNPTRSKKDGSVRDALECYLNHLKEQGREPTSRRITTKFLQAVWGDPLAAIKMSELTEEDVSEWRERLKDGRQPRSVNRLVRDLQAGLNRAIKKSYPGNPAAWKLDPLTDDVEGIGTAVMLTPKQRKALIAAAGKEAGLFFRGLELTGARPGELAAATVGDFGGKAGTLRLSHRKGRKQKLRVRAVVLSKEGVTYFQQQARSKLPAAPLFTDSGHKRWDRSEWARAFREARDKVNAKARGKARIPADASCYGFRHARISELLQVYKLDPLSVAQQTGTSVKMIELTYFKFIEAAFREMLAAVDEA